MAVEWERWSSPAVADGVVYVECSNVYVEALDASSGELLWRYETGDGVGSSPAVKDSVVYVGSYDNYVYSVDVRRPVFGRCAGRVLLTLGRWL